MLSDIKNSLRIIEEKIESQKGIYTVLITLAIYKSLNPTQDIRNHQENMKGGFSGRSIDTKYITPTLKSLGLTSMSESGWLTRSLEQPYPYNSDYNGKIGNGNEEIKKAFLEIVDFIQHNPKKSDAIVDFLLTAAELIKKRNAVEIRPISNPEKVTIENVILCLEKLFAENYNISGGSKLPVIAFHSIYQLLIKEVGRYSGMKLNDLGSHTSSDRTAKTSGDIEIFNNNELFESLEIKFNHFIDSHIVNLAIDKIIRFNPKRYYILSTYPIKNEDADTINTAVIELRESHGCQLIINGLVPTLKYYLRLVKNSQDFLETFTQMVIHDKELKIIHKNKWKELVHHSFN